MWYRMTDVPTQFAGALILCSDGTVLARDLDAPRWWRLSPDANGHYLHGRWTAGPPPVHGFRLNDNSIAPLRSGAFIDVGDVAREDDDDTFPVIAGPAEVSNVGVTAWAAQPTVRGWNGIAAATCSLPDGGIIAAPYIGPPPVASDGLLWQWNESAGWSVIGDLPDGIPVLASLTLLPDGSVLTLGPALEYRYQSGSWETGSSHGLRSDDVVGVVSGPVCLLADGRVLALDHLGGLALRTPDGRWSAAGQLPDRDGLSPYAYASSAGLLPSGRVLIGAEYSSVRDGLVYIHYHYYEWSPGDGSITDVGGAAPDGSASSITVGAPERGMLVLPDGSVLLARIFDMALYVPDVPAAAPSWSPRIERVGTFGRDETIVFGAAEDLALEGRRFTGAGQACYAPFGIANPTNYPLVRLEYPDGAVQYCQTRNHSTLGVGTSEAFQSTTFTVPADARPGDARLCVVVNGLSDCVPVRIQAAPHFSRFPGYQKLVGSLADGVLWVLTHGGFQPTPPGPNDGRIIAAYERILKGIETLSRADETADPSIPAAQRAPGVSSILSGIRTLRAAGKQNRQRPTSRSKR